MGRCRQTGWRRCSTSWHTHVRGGPGTANPKLAWRLDLARVTHLARDRGRSRREVARGRGARRGGGAGGAGGSGEAAPPPPRPCGSCRARWSCGGAGRRDEGPARRALSTAPHTDRRGGTCDEQRAAEAAADGGGGEGGSPRQVRRRRRWWRARRRGKTVAVDVQEGVAEEEEVTGVNVEAVGARGWLAGRWQAARVGCGGKQRGGGSSGHSAVAGGALRGQVQLDALRPGAEAEVRRR